MNRIILFSSLAALLLSCSDKNTVTGDASLPVMVESFSELSDYDCTDCTEDTQVFVRNENNYYSWNGEKWEKVSSQEKTKSSNSSEPDEESSNSDEDEISSCSEEGGMSSSSKNKKKSSSSKNVEESSSSQETSNSSTALQSSSSERVSWRQMNQNFSYGEMIDTRDSTIYRTIQIGDQLWLAEDMIYDIPEFDEKDDACQAYKPDNCNRGFGRYYTWYAAMNISREDCDEDTTCPDLYKYPHQGVCPKGWHIPDSLDWEKLFEPFGLEDGLSAVAGTLHAKSFGFNFVGSDYQNKGKDPNVKGDFPYGYLILGKEKKVNGKYLSAVYQAEFFYRSITLTTLSKDDAIPVRCLKDDPVEIASRNDKQGEE